MDFALSAEQKLIYQTAKDFADNEIAPRALDWEKEEEIPDKSEMATTENKNAEKKRSGEYELPPPPEI